MGFDECGPHEKLKTFSVWNLRVAMLHVPFEKYLLKMYLLLKNSDLPASHVSLRGLYIDPHQFM